MAGISTTPAQPPAPSGLRSKGHMVVENISRSRKAPLWGPKPREKVGAGVEKVGAPASSSEVVIETDVEQVDAGGQKVNAAGCVSTSVANIDKRRTRRLPAGPVPPIMPPPTHLRRELTPKHGHGIPKHMGSPPEKKVRFQ